MNNGTPFGGSYFGNSFISNDTLYALAAVNAGNDSFFVYYTYTDANGCSATDSAFQLLNICSGIENTEENTILVYPNPAQAYLTIKSSDKIMQAINVLTVLGQVVIAEQANNRTETTMNISMLPPGNYILRLDSYHIKFVKSQ